MLDFKLSEVFAVELSQFIELFWDDATFKTLFHNRRGDQKVDVSEWIPIGPEAAQRVCVFTMMENNDSGAQEGSRCMETQKKQRNTVTGDIEIHSNIVPDNALGNIFKIEAMWTISRTTRNGGDVGALDYTKVSISGNVECKKKMWKVQDYAERWLKQQAEELHSAWFKLANEKLDERKKASIQRVAEDTTKLIADTTKEMTKRTFARFQKVIGGTEKFVTMLALENFEQNEEPNMPPEGCFSSITIPDLGETIDEHDDSDLKKPPRRRLQEQRVRRYVLMGVLSVILMLLIALFYRMTK